MATKSQRFRSEQERSKPPRPKQVVKPPRAVRTNERASLHGDAKSTVAFEDAAVDGSRSRKSTRKSSNRQRSGASKEHAMQMKSATASSRHGRRSG